MDWRVDYRPSYSLLKVVLEPGEEVTSEAGAMVLYKGDIEIKTHTGGLMKGILRALAGTESLFLNTILRVPAAKYGLLQLYRVIFHIFLSIVMAGLYKILAI